MLTRKRAQNVKNFNYANLNWLKGNVFGKPQTRGRKHTPMPIDSNNWSATVEFPGAKPDNVNLITFPAANTPSKGKSDNENLITFPSKNNTKQNNISVANINKRKKAATKIQALVKGQQTRKLFNKVKKIKGFTSKFKGISDEIKKVTPETIGLGKIVYNAINELEFDNEHKELEDNTKAILMLLLLDRLQPHGERNA